MRKVVFAFGRFQPPSTGHEKLVRKVYELSAQIGADAIIFPSLTQDGKTNPLPFKEKHRFLTRLFPYMNFSNGNIRNPVEALQVLSKLGYDAAYFVVGQDRAKDFERVKPYIKSRKYCQSNADIALEHFEVVPIARAKDAVSGTAMRDAAVAYDFTKFAAMVPTVHQGLAMQLFNSVRRHMGCQSKRTSSDQ